MQLPIFVNSKIAVHSDVRYSPIWNGFHQYVQISWFYLPNGNVNIPSAIDEYSLSTPAGWSQLLLFHWGTGLTLIRLPTFERLRPALVCLGVVSWDGARCGKLERWVSRQPPYHRCRSFNTREGRIVTWAVQIPSPKAFGTDSDNFNSNMWLFEQVSLWM